MAHATAHEHRSSLPPSGRRLVVWEMEHNGVPLIIDRTGDTGPYFWRAHLAGNSVMNSAPTFGEAHAAAIRAADDLIARRCDHIGSVWSCCATCGTTWDADQP